MGLPTATCWPRCDRNILCFAREGIGLVKSNVSGEMIEFEVMARAITAFGEEIGNRTGPQLANARPPRAPSADFGRF